MRNLKKILALALVFAMAFTFTASAASFTDQAEIGANYVDDVNMLVELGVISGYPDGSFGPQKNITRAEFAKMAYTLKYGSDADGNLFAAQASKFTDVEGNSNVAWAKGYINYCANQNIVAGVGNNKFNPNGNITVAEATKMILVIMGCDPTKEGFVGANWMANVTAKAIDLGIFDGWAGDPSALATRELVAKLMRNAIFSPVYEYSAITGTGSQLNLMGVLNPTLGEKTMGLHSVTGIVVANERYALANGIEGEVLGDLDDDTTTDISGGLPNATGEESGESVIYYEYKDSAGDITPALLTIDRAVEDDLLGNKVNVFFKADVNSSAEYDYKNVEVIGNVLVHSDTQAYTVASKDITIYPDASTNSNTSIVPYISFKVDGVEKQVKADASLGRFPKSADFQADWSTIVNADSQAASAVFTYWAGFAYSSDETIRGNGAASLANPTNGGDVFFSDMGTASLSNYRFVSVNGGKSYSYIFKMVADNTVTNANYGTVTNYSESKGVITIDNLGTYDIADVAIEGTVATDDLVAYYRENGKINIAKIEAVTGAVEDILDDGGVVIGGETYYGWKNLNAMGSYSTLNDLYVAQKTAMGGNTTYYVYNNIVFDVETSAVAASVENYAVIVRSYYDQNMNTAYVTLGFADNSEATYAVGKFNIEDRTDVYAANNDKASDFANNAYFGAVVQYKVLANGTVDLSGQDFGKTNQSGQTFNYYSDGVPAYSSFPAGINGTIGQSQAFEGEFRVGTSTFYATNSGSVLFVLYGNPAYATDGTDLWTDTTAQNVRPVKAVAYKLSEKAQQPIGAIPAIALGTDVATGPIVGSYSTLSYVFNTSVGANKSIVAAAMTVGATAAADSGDAAAGEALAYIVSSTQKYDIAADEYYAVLTIIDENGLNTYTTVNDVKDYNNQSVLVAQEGTGKMLNRFTAGTFVEYRLDAEGKIANMEDTRNASLGYTVGLGEDLTVVNAVSERDGRLYFFETASQVDPQLAATTALKFAEDGYSIITIDDGAYLGSSLIKCSTRAILPAQTGNAVIHTDAAGEIVRVFSFVDGF